MTNFEITNQAVELVRDNNKAHHDHILLFAINWVKTQFKSFTSENLKESYYSQGNPHPVEPRVFGSVFRELSRSGLFLNTVSNYQKTLKTIVDHNKLGISKEFKQKQSNNAKKEQTLNLFQ